MGCVVPRHLLVPLIDMGRKVWIGCWYFGKRPPLVKLLENPLLMAVVLTAGGRALLVVELPLFGKKPPLMAVAPAVGGKALHIVELPLFGKRPPLMAVVLAAGGRALLVAETPMLWKKPPLMAVIPAAMVKLCTLWSFYCLVRNLHRWLLYFLKVI